jgi:hypothetical protein
VEHAARGPGVLEQRLLLTGRFFRGVQGPSRPRKNLPEARRARMSTCEARSGTAARVDLTAPVKIYIIIIVHIHRNEHEFYCVKSLWRAAASPPPAAPPRSIGHHNVILGSGCMQTYYYYLGYWSFPTLEYPRDFHYELHNEQITLVLDSLRRIPIRIL